MWESSSSAPRDPIVQGRRFEGVANDQGRKMTMERAGKLEVGLRREPAPEEQEIIRKREEVAGLRERVADLELEWTALQAELDAFERIYLSGVGRLYSELDQIEAEILALFAQQSPKDPGLRERATAARDHAFETRSAVEEATQGPDRELPSAELKQLFREIAKRVHPDLAVDEEDRQRREELMRDANLAYAACDRDRLLAILGRIENEWPPVHGEGPGAELIRLIRQIPQLNDRIKTIERFLADARQTDLFQLMEAARDAETAGRDLLAEMNRDIGQRIRNARERLARARHGVK